MLDDDNGAKRGCESLKESYLPGVYLLLMFTDYKRLGFLLLYGDLSIDFPF